MIYEYGYIAAFRLVLKNVKMFLFRFILTQLKQREVVSIAICLELCVLACLSFIRQCAAECHKISLVLNVCRTSSLIREVFSNGNDRNCRATYSLRRGLTRKLKRFFNQVGGTGLNDVKRHLHNL